MQVTADTIEIDLKQEHAATLARAPYAYSAIARVYFGGMDAGYAVFIRLLTRVNPRRALRFNGEFEDHAEHGYAEFVVAHPEWEALPVPESLAPLQGYPHLHTWADVFRRFSLDERAHGDRSFELAQSTS